MIYLCRNIFLDIDVRVDLHVGLALTHNCKVKDERVVAHNEIKLRGIAHNSGIVHTRRVL